MTKKDFVSEKWLDFFDIKVDENLVVNINSAYNNYSDYENKSKNGFHDGRGGTSKEKFKNDFSYLKRNSFNNSLEVQAQLKAKETNFENKNIESTAFKRFFNRTVKKEATELRSSKSFLNYEGFDKSTNLNYADQYRRNSFKLNLGGEFNSTRKRSANEVATEYIRQQNGLEARKVGSYKLFNY